MTIRICGDNFHVPGCHHEVYMRQGWERGITHPRVRRALATALAVSPAPIDPYAWADRVLVEMAAGYAELDTPTVGMFDNVTAGDLATMDVWCSEAMTPPGVEVR